MKMIPNEDYEKIGQDRAKALAQSLKQTFEEHYTKFKVDHPELDEATAYVICRIAWYRAWRKL